MKTKTPKTIVKLTILCVAAISLCFSCSSMKIEDFKGATPAFVLEQYFSGKTRAWGVVHDRFGDLRRQFVVDIQGDWDGSQLVLTEDFVYSDGEKEQRIWKIRKIDEQTYEGTAGDVIGTAEGKQLGNALHWQYQMNLKMGEYRMKVRFNDWMYLQSDGVLINRAVIYKAGIEIAEVSIFFRK